MSQKNDSRHERITQIRREQKKIQSEVEELKALVIPLVEEPKTAAEPKKHCFNCKHYITDLCNNCLHHENWELYEKQKAAELNNAITETIDSITREIEENDEAFIIKTITPYCEKIAEQKLPKDTLKVALDVYLLHSCENCLHEDKPKDKEPCKDCVMTHVSNWESKYSKRAAEPERTCATCKYYNGHDMTYQCNECFDYGHWIEAK